MKDELKARIQTFSNGDIPVGYKKNKGQVSPAEWETWELGKVLKKVMRPVKVKLDEKYRQIGIRSHGKGLFYKEAVSGEELGNKSVFWIEPDCFIVNIVFAWEMAVGKTTEYENGMIASHRFPMYKPKNNKIDIDYLTYYFKSNRGKYLLELASPGGAGRNKTLGQVEFMKLKIPFPLLQEQQKIAEILSTWDKAIELKEKLIEEKKKYKTGLIQKLLNGKHRLTGYRTNWKKIKIKELCTLITDGDWIESKDQSDSGTRLIQTGNIGVGKFIDKPANSKYISEETFLSLNCKEVFPGDVIISRLPDPIGRACIIPKLEYKMVTAVDCTILRFKDFIVSQYFIQYSSTYEYLKRIMSLSAGSTRMRVSRKEIENLEILIPTSIDDLTKVVNIFTKADAEIELLHKEVEEIKHQKKGLIQLLLTGIVRVNIKEN